MELRASDLSFSYNGRSTLDHVTIAVRSGQTVGVIGPNGSGKSTLLRLLARALPPQAGEVTIDGRNIAGMERNALARLVAVVPQSPVLPDAFTVEETILLGRTPHLGFLETEGPRDLAIARRAMELTDTLPFAARRLAQLSGGERQRVVVARALAQEARFLLLDEPTTYLDLSHQQGLLQLVARLVHEENLGVLTAFHDLNTASEYCDEIAVLSQGRVRAHGAPDDVLTAAVIEAAFATPVCIIPHPVTGRPLIIPRAA